MAIKLPNGKIARTIAEQVYKNMQDIVFLMNKKDFQILVVDELPEEGQENTLYLVPSDDPEQHNVYTEYVWTGTAFEMVGTTAIDISNMVTTDTNQNIVGEKTFESSVEFYDEIVLTVDAAFTGDILPKSTDSYDIGSSTYKWHDLYASHEVIIDDTSLSRSSDYNGIEITLGKNLVLGGILFPRYTNSFNIGSSGNCWDYIYVNNLSNGSGDMKSHCNLIPSANNALDLGSASYAWKDLHLSNSITIKNPDQAVTYGWTIDEDTMERLRFKRNNVTRFYIAAGLALTETVAPFTHDAYDLGRTNYYYRNLYLSGIAYVPIIEDSSQVLFKINGNNRYYLNDNAIFPANNNLKDLGRNGNTWRNLYLAGDLTDGTNSVNVADLKALIDYAKAQGWIS